MGMSASFDAWDGGEMSFEHFRQCVAAAMGGSFPPHYDYAPGGTLVMEVGEFGLKRAKLRDELESTCWYAGDGMTKATHPGLFAFLNLAVYRGGNIPAALCSPLADELQSLLPAIAGLGWDHGGHIGRDGGYVAVTERLIRGCRRAAESAKPIRFT